MKGLQSTLFTDAIWHLCKKSHSYLDQQTVMSFVSLSAKWFDTPLFSDQMV